MDPITALFASSVLVWLGFGLYGLFLAGRLSRLTDRCLRLEKRHD